MISFPTTTLLHGVSMEGSPFGKELTSHLNSYERNFKKVITLTNLRARKIKKVLELQKPHYVVMVAVSTEFYSKE